MLQSGCQKALAFCDEIPSRRKPRIEERAAGCKSDEDFLPVLPPGWSNIRWNIQADKCLYKGQITVSWVRGRRGMGLIPCTGSIWHRFERHFIFGAWNLQMAVSELVHGGLGGYILRRNEWPSLPLAASAFCYRDKKKKKRSKISEERRGPANGLITLPWSSSVQSANVLYLDNTGEMGECTIYIFIGSSGRLQVMRSSARSSTENRTGVLSTKWYGKPYFYFPI